MASTSAIFYGGSTTPPLRRPPAPAIPPSTPSSSCLSYPSFCSPGSITKPLFGRHRKLPSPKRFAIKCGVAEINESQFPEVVLKSDRPVLVEFVAGWCGPCRLISPVIQSIAQEYEEKLLVVKIDHDENPKLIEEYKVYGLPALILFKDGKEIPGSRREGAITKAKLKDYVDALLASGSSVG